MTIPAGTNARTTSTETCHPHLRTGHPFLFAFRALDVNASRPRKKKTICTQRCNKWTRSFK